NSSFNSFLATGPIRGIAMGAAGQTMADVGVADLMLTFGANTISAQSVAGHAVADGQTGNRPTVSGSSDIQGLIVNGQSISITGLPNQQVDLLNNARLLINEQFSSMGDNSGSILVNALHLYGSPVVDFRIASADAGITVSASPAVPEPGTLTLLTVGLVGLLGLWRRHEDTASN